jgi:hypothetical protein
LTGKPLGVTGEVSEYVVAQALRLKLAPPRTPGYDATRMRGGKTPGENTTVVKNAGTLQGIDTVLYTQVAANIQPLTAQELARLAVESVRKAEPGMDGITYLMAALGRGLKTPLRKSSGWPARIV